MHHISGAHSMQNDHQYFSLVLRFLTRCVARAVLQDSQKFLRKKDRSAALPVFFAQRDMFLIRQVENLEWHCDHCSLWHLLSNRKLGSLPTGSEWSAVSHSSADLFFQYNDFTVTVPRVTLLSGTAHSIISSCSTESHFPLCFFPMLCETVNLKSYSEPRQRLTKKEMCNYQSFLWIL